MIKCPKCGSEHISIVTEVKSEKTSKNGLDTLQYLTGIVLFFAIIVLAIDIFTCKEAIGYIIDGKADIIGTLDIGASIIKDVNEIMLAMKVTKNSLLIIIIIGFVKILLPHRTYSTEKCICHECENEWKRIEDEK